MQEEQERRIAEAYAVRDELTALHERGKQIHQRFLAASARGDREAMSQAAAEHAAINEQAIRLLSPMQEQVRRHQRKTTRHP